MATLQEIRAKLLANQKGAGTNNTRERSSGGDNASYPFWNAPVGTNATVRFLPDADQDNALFWVPRTVIKLPFEGVVGGEYPTNKPVTVTVPCNEMFGGKCPVTEAIRPLWKGSEEDKNLARQYYRKKSFLFQGFVVSSPFEEQSKPENPIRRFVINSSIYEIIEKALTDPDMEDSPVDYVGGVDFRIDVSQRGEYRNYGGSKYARKPRSLSEAEMAAIEKHGLFDLKQFLGRKPDAEELEAIKTLYEMSRAGEPFDQEAFGQWYRPWGARGGDEAGTPDSRPAPAPRTPAPVREAAPAPVAEVEAPAPVAPAAPSEGKSNPSDILERIRLRTQK